MAEVEVEQGDVQERQNSKNRMDTQSLRDIFRMFDADGSGSVDINELSDAMRLLGIKCSTGTVKKVMAVIDTDGNGTVEWEEFEAFFARVKDPDELKQLLSSTTATFLDYKVMVDGDAAFKNRFLTPPAFQANQCFAGHNDNVEAVAWLSDNSFISCSLDRELKIWDATEGVAKSAQCIRTIIGAPAGMYCLKPIIERKRCLTGFGDRTETLWLWNLESGQCEMKYQGHDTAVYCINVTSDNSKLVSGSKAGRLVHHDIERAEAVSISELHDGVVSSCCFNDDCATICSSSTDGTVEISCLKSPDRNKPVLTIEEASASGAVNKALWRGPFELLTCGDDYCVKKWDIRSLQAGPTTNFFGHTSSVRDIALSPSGALVVSATNDGCIRVWAIDELNTIADMQDLLDGKIEQCEKHREDLAQQLDRGVDISGKELKRAIDESNYCYDQADWLKEVREERNSLGCIQARLEIQGHNHCVSAVDWIDNPQFNNCAQVVSASQDQTLRVARFQPPDVSKFVRWQCSHDEQRRKNSD